jgi:hypothetical protein
MYLNVPGDNKRLGKMRFRKEMDECGRSKSTREEGSTLHISIWLPRLLLIPSLESFLSHNSCKIPQRVRRY